MYFFFFFFLNFIRSLYKFLPLSRVQPITLWAGGPEVSALEEQAEGRGFEPPSNREKFQTINTPSSYSTRPVLSKKVDSEALGDRQRHQVCMGDS